MAYLDGRFHWLQGSVQSTDHLAGPIDVVGDAAYGGAHACPLPAVVAAEATEALHRLVGREADFRPGQLEAIEALVAERRRVLVVQRTGWGKSAVYIVATALLRAAGAGPTVIVSPLLALMRDQVAAAERAGIRAVTMNSANAEDWADVGRALAADEVDLLLVSPERLNNPRFREEQLPGLAAAMRAPRRRRGALRQRLGSRLPAGLPADPRPAHRPCRPTRRSSPRPRRRTRGWSPTSPSSWGPAATTCSPCAAGWPATRCGWGCSRSVPPSSGWPGWWPTSATSPAAGSSTP